MLVKTILTVVLSLMLVVPVISQEPAKPKTNDIPLNAEEIKALDELKAEQAQIQIDIERIQARQREFNLKAQNLELKAKLRTKCDDCTLQANGVLTKPEAKPEKK